MKFKTKKEMSLHELIQWARENDVKCKTFTSDYGRKVKFYSDYSFKTLEDIFHYETFTVEVEEELTERTVIPNLLVTYQFDGITVLEVRKDKSIKDILDLYDYDGVTVKALHTVNDDSTHTLIWKDGELVK